MTNFMRHGRAICIGAVVTAIFALLCGSNSAQAQLPSGWTAGDIGSPLPAGSTSYSNGTFTVTGGGYLNDRTSDKHHFVHQSKSGNFTFTAKLESLSGPWGARTALVLREGSASDSRMAFLGLESNVDPRAGARTVAGDKSSTRLFNFDESFPQWVRVVRYGDALSFYKSTDGSQWAHFYKQEFPQLASNVLVGMATASNSGTSTASAVWSNVSFAGVTRTHQHGWLANSYSGAGQAMISVGQYLWVEPASGEVFIAGGNERQDFLVLDSSGNLVQRLFDGYPDGITSDSTYYYVARNDRNGVLRIKKTDRSETWVLTDREVSGLAIRNGELFVIDNTDDTCKVFRTSDMVQIRSFPIATGSYSACVDNNNVLWVVQQVTATNASGSVKRYNTADGSTPSGNASISFANFSEVVKPRGIAYNPVDGKVWVCDEGVRQQLHIYNSDGSYASSFGDYKGIYSGTPGLAAPHKLNFPVGVGFDQGGNLYVINSGPENGWFPGPATGSMSELIKFNTSSPRSQVWVRRGQEFVDVADATPGSNATDVHTAEFRYSIAYGSNGPTHTYRATTLDPFKYPTDPRIVHGMATTRMRKDAAGNKFMFLSGQGGDWTTFVYRFTSNSEIAIPAFYIRVKSTGSGGAMEYWYDRDGDGQIEDTEKTVQAISTDYKRYEVSANCDIVAADKQFGIWRWKYQGVDSNGVPRWALDSNNAWNFSQPTYLQIWGVPQYTPAGSSTVDKFWSSRATYDEANDVMYLAGESWANAMTIRRYDAWSGGDRTPEWEVILPYIAGVMQHGEDVQEAKSFVVEGDYVFVAMRNPEHKTPSRHSIRILRKSDGAFVTELFGGPEVGGYTDMIDMAYSIMARKRSDGTYVMFTEEITGAKVSVWVWTPPGTTSPSPTPGTAVEPVASRSYRLKNKQYSQYLDGDNDSLVDMRNDAVDNDTVWTLQDAGSGYFYLLNKRYNQRLDADNSGSVDVNDVNLDASSATGTDKQWLFVSADDGSYYLTNRYFDRRLDGDGSNNVDLYDSVNGTTNDVRWMLEEVADVVVNDGAYRLKNKAYNAFLKGSGDQSVGLDVSSLGTDREWELVAQGGGYYTIKNKSHSTFLDADDASVVDLGSSTTSPPADDKQWKLEDAGDGSFYLLSKSHTQRLDGDSSSDGELSVDLTGASETGNNKRWILEPVS